MAQGIVPELWWHPQKGEAVIHEQQVTGLYTQTPSGQRAKPSSVESCLLMGRCPFLKDHWFSEHRKKRRWLLGTLRTRPGLAKAGWLTAEHHDSKKSGPRSAWATFLPPVRTGPAGIGVPLCRTLLQPLQTSSIPMLIADLEGCSLPLRWKS